MWILVTLVIFQGDGLVVALGSIILWSMDHGGVSSFLFVGFREQKSYVVVL